MSKKIAHLLLLILVSISTFLSSSALSSFVLCLGQDGHLEVEYSVDGKCGTTGKQDQEAAWKTSDEEPHCGTCTDITLAASEEEASRPVHSFETPHLFALDDQGRFSAFHLDRTLPGHLSLPPPAVSPHLAHLTTVRLLV